MKRLSVLLICVLLVFSSCSELSIKKEIPPLPTVFAGDISFDYHGISYAALLRCSSFDDISLEFSRPDGMNGISFRRTDGVIEADADGVTAKFETRMLPADGMLGMLTDAVFDLFYCETVKTETETEYVYTSSDGKSSVIFGKSDFTPSRIEIGEYKINFDSFTVG